MEHKCEGVQAIADERRRQIEKLGWSPEHDDKHTDRALVKAALCYAVAGSEPSEVLVNDPSFPWDVWPWERRWWRMDADPVRNLERAGALIAAEIDRLKRLQRRNAGN